MRGLSVAMAIILWRMESAYKFGKEKNKIEQHSQDENVYSKARIVIPTAASK
jgi:hypothetical protein